MSPNSTKTDFRRLRIRQLDETLTSARTCLTHFVVPRNGWIREIRQALGMTTGQLAKRIGTPQSNVHGLEKRERDGRITLRSLTKAAEALDCEVVYFLIPRKGLEATLLERIEMFVQRRIGSVAHTMALEEQPVSDSHLKRQFDDSVQELMVHPPRNLWA
jgi:predicted DNA-binding mobile mystery protein A